MVVMVAMLVVEPHVIKDMMLPNNCKCQINPMYQVEDKISYTLF